MRIVAALGGNALMRRGDKPDARTQIANVRSAAKQLALLAEKHELIITHGNGPQVGVLALESANDDRLSECYPFDTLGAETQGMIGYWLLQAMQNALPGRQVASLVSQTLVLAGDPAFANPTKFVGEVYDEATANRLASEKGWTVKKDGEHYRRVVGSPRPQRVIETRMARALLHAGAVVICAGGGGVPVIRNEHGKLQGVEAVIDKDLTAAVLAEHLDADALLILTDVDGVQEGFGTPEAKRVDRATPASLRAMDLPAGSMGPKVEAVCRFVELTGDMAAIGRLEDAIGIIEGTSGTIVTPGGNYGGPDDIRPPVPDRTTN
ncbi:carbamate kinase [Actinomyces gaoshouyii]|uniref:Carbamate kinase n=1 Tax=Actinomyces gaoshouyii TaxID=1960083 RepID=A0A8H9H7I9_9ACTO|nr:carbamate kinase [Actinomyces gaoshouyii]ARD42418.1 carbamate kinase [Actinomyces gaoshouyii]GGO95473.1 carbamate kinase [Actinomyces gaoshouyii]